MINQIHHGDCVNLMAQLPAGSIDLTVTSPPYDGLRTYNGYSFDFEAVAAELYRVTKEGGVVVWVVGDATVKGSETGTSFRQALHFMQCGFSLHDTMIWEKTPLPQNQHPRYSPLFEYMFILCKGSAPRAFNPLTEPSIKAGVTTTSRGQRNANDAYRHDAGNTMTISATKRRGNIWRIPTGNNSTTKDRIAYEHPAIFPEKLAADHILSWSNLGDTVLDPFAGSGTTAKMAVANNRNYIGCEISAEYVTIARARVASLQPTFTF